MRRLPPRVDMFVRHVGTIVITYLAIGGALAIYDGHAKTQHWWMIAALLVGSALGVLMRDVPAQHRDDRELNRA